MLLTGVACHRRVPDGDENKLTTQRAAANQGSAGLGPIAPRYCRGSAQAGRGATESVSNRRPNGVSAGTASAALARLAAEGLVVRLPRRGSYVADARQLHQKRELRVIDLVRTLAGPEVALRHSELVWIEELTRIGRQRGWIDHWHHLYPREAEIADQFVDQLADAWGVLIRKPRGTGTALAAVSPRCACRLASSSDTFTGLFPADQRGPPKDRLGGRGSSGGAGLSTHCLARVGQLAAAHDGFS